MHKPRFNIHAWLECVNYLIDSDEVERALWMLNNPPAYYRQNPLEEIESLKAEVLSKLLTAHSYMTANFDCDVVDAAMAQNLILGTLRGVAIEAEARWNKLWIADLGPGEYFIPIGLKAMGLEFAYTPIAMDLKAKAQFEALSLTFLDSNQPLIKCFVANEVIEHLSNPKELAWEAHKVFSSPPDVIHISTPNLCYDTKPKDWRTLGLPHLRAYTPREFLIEVQSIFPDFELELYLNPIMSIRGVRRGCDIMRPLLK